MSEDDKSDSSTSESEVSACSSSFDPYKALYSSKTPIPIKKAPLYDNVALYESSQKTQNVIPIGHTDLVKKREEEKKEAELAKQKEIEEINKQRFSQYENQGLTRVPRKEYKSKNVLSRIDVINGPLAALRECVDKRIRVKVITRNATGIRGVLHATLVAFDKQWNLALTDVLEIWKRKAVKKRKVPPAMGTPVAKGTAATISPVATVTETPLGGGVWECTRHLPQLLVRGEHVVLVNVVER